jgi:hypothetical protein
MQFDNAIGGVTDRLLWLPLQPSFRFAGQSDETLESVSNLFLRFFRNVEAIRIWPI